MLSDALATHMNNTRRKRQRTPQKSRTSKVWWTTHGSASAQQNRSASQAKHKRSWRRATTQCCDGCAPWRPARSRKRSGRAIVMWPSAPLVCRHRAPRQPFERLSETGGLGWLMSTSGFSPDSGTLYGDECDRCQYSWLFSTANI